MRINRIRNFKKSFEVTITVTPREAERLSHAIGNLYSWANTKDLTEHLGYPEYTREGAKLLLSLDSGAFWTHWQSNFDINEFGPKRANMA